MNELIQELSVMPMKEFIALCIVVIAIIVMLFK